MNGIERVGNKLPHPITLFFILAVLVVVLSAVLSALGVSATGDLINTSTNTMEEQTVTVVSLMTREGIVHMLTNAVTIFTSYAPLGMVLVAMLGVGIAESSGFIAAIPAQIRSIGSCMPMTPVEATST